MNGNGTTKPVQQENRRTKIDPDNIHRLFNDEYRDIEVLEDGTIRERSAKGDGTDEVVTRSLKTGRTWYGA